MVDSSTTQAIDALIFEKQDLERALLDVRDLLERERDEKL